MSVFGWIFFGFIIGLMARGIMPGRTPIGLIGTTSLGIVGALAAGFFGQVMKWYRPDQGAGFIAASIGAVGLLTLYYFTYGRRVSKNRNARNDRNIRRAA